MYNFLNVHPKGKIVNDCVKRAFTVVTQRNYKDVSKELNQIKRELNQSAFNSDKVWRKFIELYSKEKLSFPAVKGIKRMDGTSFTNEYPKGRYILRMAGHLSVCVDGVIYDTWNCSNKCVYNAWRF